MSYSHYSEYKESGVQWLGKIPNHWRVEPFKRQIDRNDGGVWGEDPDGVNDTFVLRSTEQTANGQWKIDDPATRKLSDVEINSSLLKDGDLLLTKSSGSSLHIGKTTLVTSEIAAMKCCYSNFMQRIRTKPTFLPALAWHVLNSDLARLQFDLLSNSTTGLANLNSTMIGQMILPVPPLEEQMKISAFLDRETEKIDDLAKAFDGLIDLLKEKRQAVISHAVTKGLDPLVPMKDSGVEWVGKIPASWRFGSLSYFATLSTGSTPDRSQPHFWNGEIPWVKTGEIKYATIVETEECITAEGLESCSVNLAPAGTLLMALYGQGVTRGRVATLGIPATFNQACAAIQVGPVVDVRFLQAFFEFSYPFIRGIGNETTQMNLNLEFVRKIRIAAPPIEEQKAIADFIEIESGNLDRLIHEASRSMELLQERRTALISAAVTGKIDVRGLFDVVEEEKLLETA